MKIDLSNLPTQQNKADERQGKLICTLFVKKTLPFKERSKKSSILKLTAFGLMTFRQHSISCSCISLCSSVSIHCGS